jgi:elongation factor P
MKLNQFRRGMLFRQDGELWQIISMDLNTPGNWRSMFQVKMKNILKGNVITKRIAPTEDLEDVFLDTHDMEYLYREGENYVFMDTENYEQITLMPDQVGEAAQYLRLNEVVKVQMIEGKPINLELPPVVVLEVKDTEPGLKGATVTNVNKPAKLETGVTVKVPNFIEIGEKVKVDTRTGEFLGRA